MTSRSVARRLRAAAPGPGGDSALPQVNPCNLDPHALDPAHLLVEYLPALPLELPLYEEVGVGGGHIVPDVDDAQLLSNTPRPRSGHPRPQVIVRGKKGTDNLPLSNDPKTRVLRDQERRRNDPWTSLLVWVTGSRPPLRGEHSPTLFYRLQARRFGS
jgi:hypothetical protein